MNDLKHFIDLAEIAGMAWAVDLLFFICAFAAPVAVAFGMLADVQGQLLELF